MEDIKRTNVLAYGWFRYQEYYWKKIIRDVGMYGLNLIGYSVKIPGFGLFDANEIPVAMHSADYESKIIVDIIGASPAAYVLIKAYAQKQSLHEEIVLMPSGPHIIFVSSTLQNRWKRVTYGDWLMLNKQLPSNIETLFAHEPERSSSSILSQGGVSSEDRWLQDPRSRAFKGLAAIRGKFDEEEDTNDYPHGMPGF